MRAKTGALKTTILGGVVFLLPFIVVIAVAGKAYEIMHVIAQPIADAIGIERIGFVAMVNIVTVAVTLGLCYLAGLAANKARGRRLHQAIDERLLDLFPRYAFLKALAGGFANEPGATLGVVQVRLDDQSQVGFEVERDAERVVVYLPGSPDPWSGVVSLVTPDRVQPLDVDFRTAVKSMRLAGRGALQVLSQAHRS